MNPFLGPLMALGLVVALAPASALAQRADLAAPRLDANGQILASFLRTHEQFVDIASKGGAQVVFLGDSVTAGWANHPDLFEREYGRHRAVNFGLSGDQTQHLLWRIDNRTLDGLQPKVVVLMIGTNNSRIADHTPQQTARGIRKIIRAIHRRSPTTKVLLLAILPRGSAAADAKNQQVNALIAKYHDGSRTHYLDMRRSFLGPDGQVSREIMPDELHLSELGYRIWADTMRSTLNDLTR